MQSTGRVALQALVCIFVTKTILRLNLNEQIDFKANHQGHYRSVYMAFLLGSTSTMAQRSFGLPSRNLVARPSPPLLRKSTGESRRPVNIQSNFSWSFVLPLPIDSIYIHLNLSFLWKKQFGIDLSKANGDPTFDQGGDKFALLDASKKRTEHATKEVHKPDQQQSKYGQAP